MKLYTEAEIISAYEKAELCHLRLESFIELMNPIKLPSDEEIKQEADSYHGLESYNTTFVQGAKRLRDKIQGGNNDKQ